MLTKTPPTPPLAKDIHLGEFVGLIAILMAMTALSLDMMLPALPDIGQALGLREPNHRQLVITFFLLGFAFGQLIFGPLSDRFGRKRPLYVGLAIYTAGSLLALFAQDATTMFAGRALQGFGAAGPRVIAVAIVRDRFSGHAMARIMSFVLMIFVAVPVLAPSAGQGIMLHGPWRGIFVALLVIGLAALLWAWARLPETQAPEARRPLTFGRLADTARTIVTTRQTVGYTLAFGFCYGILMTYIGSAEQIFVDLYGQRAWFPLMFGGTALAVLFSGLVNSRLVGHLGPRRVGHLALLGLVLVCGAMACAGFPEKPPLIVFILFATATMFCFSLISPNFNALAMEPMGKIAGAASSFVGFYTTAVAAAFGWIAGQAFDGSVRPLTIGFTIMGCAALAAVLVTERGAFARRHPKAPGSH